jgi:hypothetical protein
MKGEKNEKGEIENSHRNINRDGEKEKERR